MTAPIEPDVIAPLNFRQGDETWTKYRARAQTDLYFFAAVVLGYGELVPMTVGAHGLLCKFVERQTGVPALDTAKYRKIELGRGWGKCQRLSSPVLVREGHYKRADEVVPGDYVLSVDNKWRATWQRVMAVQLQSPRPIYQIALRTGRVLEVSGNHPVLMFEAFCEAQHLAVGDRVAVIRQIAPHRRAPLPEAEFIGFMLGDGCCRAVLFTNADEAVLRAFERTVKRLGGTSWRRPHRTSRTIEVLIQKMRPVLRRHGIERSQSADKFIPRAVWNADDASLALCLRAMFSCDGTIDVPARRIEYSSISHQLAQDVQRALLRFGIVAALRRKRGIFRGRPYLSWLVRISTAQGRQRFARHIGFYGARAAKLRQVLDDIGRGNGDMVPASWYSRIPHTYPGGRNSESLSLKHHINFNRRKPISTDKYAHIAKTVGLKAEVRMSEAVYWDEVVAITHLAPEPTIDFEVANTHVFCANDVVTHNSTIARAYAMQRLLQNPNAAVLLANEREQTAADFLAEIKSHFETNAFLRALFPDIIPENVKHTTWTASRIILTRSHPRTEPSISVIGVSGTVIGLHPDAIIVDDAISRAAMENARSGSWDIMHQVNRWIHQLVPLLNPNAKPFPELTFIGTRWFHSDCYEHLEEHFGYGERPVRYALRLRLPDGQVQQVICFRVGDLAVFRRPAIEDGRSAFPEKWSLEDLAKIQLGDQLLFSANYLLNPSDSASAVFKLDWLREFEWIDEQRMVKYVDAVGATKRRRVADLDAIVCFDPGGFSGRSVDQRARAAICVTGSTGAGEHLLLETYSEPDTVLAGIRKLAALVTQYSPRKLVLQADEQGSVLDMVRRMLAEQGCTVPIELVPATTRQQEQHILQLEPWFQRGHIYAGKGPAFQEFRTQYSQFPRAARFDLLKALAYAPGVWKKQPGGAHLTTEERRAQELAAYKQRRGLRV